jgi:glycosyltransferase involved in cell wall biosynthesis
VWNELPPVEFRKVRSAERPQKFNEDRSDIAANRELPAQLYGGTERVVSYLTEELVKQGHDVTLFASGDSITRARLEACCERGLRLDPNVSDPIPDHLIMLDKVRRMAEDFDILHFHVDVLHYPLAVDFAIRTVTTMHGRLDLPELRRVHAAFPGFPLVSISNDQRLPMPPIEWAGTVYHGLPRDLLPFNPAPSGGYLAFLGRISPEKRPDLAIEIAVRAGARLKVAAKIDKVDQAYWANVIKPMIDSSRNVEFVGEIGDLDKGDFLGNADALLFPIDWPEPFGLVMIEAMACGTPVIAFRRGSAPEVIDHAVSGFLVDDVPQATAATERIAELDRAQVREAYERRFDIERVAREYVQIYRRLASVDEACRGERRRNGFARNLVSRAQRGYRPILVELGPEVPNAAPTD